MLDFGVFNQSVIIGVICILFCDNSNNLFEISVQVMGIGQKFIVLGNVEGYFFIMLCINSVIILESEGGVEKNVVVIFYNYDILFVVWYKYGVINKDILIKVQGVNFVGLVIVGSEYLNFDLIVVVDLDGKVWYVIVDGNGVFCIVNLDVIIGVVFGLDVVGGVFIYFGLFMVVFDSVGNVKNLVFNVDGELFVYDSKVIDVVNVLKVVVIFGVIVLMFSIIMFVVLVVVNIFILVVNLDCKGVCVFNNSVVVFRLVFGDVDVMVIYLVVV